MISIFRKFRKRRLARISSDDEIDLSDIPEVKDWTGAVRGKYYRPSPDHADPEMTREDIYKAVEKAMQSVAEPKTYADYGKVYEILPGGGIKELIPKVGIWKRLRLWWESEYD